MSKFDLPAPRAPPRPAPHDLERRAPQAARYAEHENRRDDQPIDDERVVGVLAHVAEQPVDREEAAAERRAYRRGTGPASRPEVAEQDVPHSFRTTAPSTAGSRSRNEKRAAPSRSRRISRPAVIVIPERDTPGASASARAKPTASACRSPRSPRRPPCGAVGPPEEDRAGREEDRDLPGLAEDVRDDVLAQKTRHAGGIVAEHEPGDPLIRVSMRRRATDALKARPSLTMSRQK